MKTINLLSKFIFAALFACFSCQAEPPAHKPGKIFAVTLPGTNTPPVNAATLYGANHADTVWTPLATATGTNGQTVSFPAAPLNYQIYTATSLAGTNESDYSAPWTNNLPAAPAALTAQ